MCLALHASLYDDMLFPSLAPAASTFHVIGNTVKAPKAFHPMALATDKRYSSDAVMDRKF